MVSSPHDNDDSQKAEKYRESHMLELYYKFTLYYTIGQGKALFNGTLMPSLDDFLAASIISST